MFNRGSGKIYKLPDYIRSLSDYETAVDPFTGKNASKNLSALSSNGWTTPKYMSYTSMQSMIGAQGYQTFKINGGKKLQNGGNSATTLIAKFTPIDPEVASQISGSNATGFLGRENSRVVVKGNLFSRKSSNN